MMYKCQECGTRAGIFDLYEGRCLQCRAKAGAIKHSPLETAALAAEVDAAQAAAAMARIILTTEVSHDLPIVERLEIISAECVMGTGILTDLGSAVRDIVGGRNAKLQDTLRTARRHVLEELRREAYDLGADAVVAVDLDYSEISGHNKSMLFLVATGTAVKLRSRE